jgi:ABC-type oligopeptide transport system substrate-binding subunit
LKVRRHARRHNSRRIIRDRLFLISTLTAITLAGGLAAGCSQEVSHQETDKPNLLGGNTHQESTTYKNPDGSYTTENSKQKTGG